MESINNRITLFKIKMRDWFLRHAEGPHMSIWLALFSFAESTFFPVPTDVLLIPIVAARANRWIYFAFLTTISSVIGGIVGYAIGAFIFEILGAPIIAFYGLEQEMERVAQLFADNAFLAIFISAFSPIPYKVFTLSAGFFSISLPVFIFASLLGRALRFFGVAFLARRFGRLMGRFIFNYFNTISFIAAILIIFLVIFLS